MHKQRKEIQTGEEEVKLFLCSDDMIIYEENLTDSIKKSLKLISESSKIVRYR